MFHLTFLAYYFPCKVNFEIVFSMDKNFRLYVVFWDVNVDPSCHMVLFTFDGIFSRYKIDLKFSCDLLDHTIDKPIYG
jgi:hypothetical protein